MDLGFLGNFQKKELQINPISMATLLQFSVAFIDIFGLLDGDILRPNSMFRRPLVQASENLIPTHSFTICSRPGVRSSGQFLMPVPQTKNRNISRRKCGKYVCSHEITTRVYAEEK
jgi:energy-converting hydrogenase Eha subunit F